MQILKGVPASKGIAIGSCLFCQPNCPPPVCVTILKPEEELARFRAACERAKFDLQAVFETAQKSIGKETAEIFQAQLMMLDDPDLLEAVEQKITIDRNNAEYAFYESAEKYAVMLENLTDEYLRARAADVRDVCRRVVRLLQNKPQHETDLKQPTIILAEDLAPSDTMQFDSSLILGFFTVRGGTTSHTAILSRTLGIPAVVNGEQIPSDLVENVICILDGSTGKLIINPDDSTLVEYRIQQQEEEEKSQAERSSSHQPAVTKDGKRVEVVANIGNLRDAEAAISYGSEGVGLLRTEFSYIERNLVPSEQELIDAYRAIFRTFGDYPVVIRTLDIGGDKEMAHLNLPAESNPFLGCRGLRLCFNRLDLFKPQLRAILQAGVRNNLCIMFPMVAVKQEIIQARRILQECIAELEAENLEYNRKPQVGIMIEVPAAALCADQLAKEVDFFSIGTNDLTQYTLAMDRTNSALASKVSALHPAVLRLIQIVISEGHKAGVWVGMCGEMAGEPSAIPILLGMGLDEFSMNPPAIPQAKEIIRGWDTTQAKALAEQAVKCEDPQQVEALVKSFSINKDESF